MEAIVYFRYTYQYASSDAEISECHVFIKVRETLKLKDNWYSSPDDDWNLSVQNECPMDQVRALQASHASQETAAPRTEAPQDVTSTPWDMVIITQADWKDEYVFGIFSTTPSQDEDVSSEDETDTGTVLIVDNGTELSQEDKEK